MRVCCCYLIYTHMQHTQQYRVTHRISNEYHDEYLKGINWVCMFSDMWYMYVKWSRDELRGFKRKPDFSRQFLTRKKRFWVTYPLFWRQNPKNSVLTLKSFVFCLNLYCNFKKNCIYLKIQTISIWLLLFFCE